MDIESIQKRPGMYVGNTLNGAGLHNLVIGLVSIAVARVLGGTAEKVEVILHPDGAATVRFSGKAGSATDRFHSDADARREAAVSTIKSIDLRRHDAKVAGGLLGPDTCTVNALSEWMTDRCWAGAISSEWNFRSGKLASESSQATPAFQASRGEQGAAVTFLPDRRFFSSTVFDASRLEAALANLSRLNGDVAIEFSDDRGPLG